MIVIYYVTFTNRRHVTALTNGRPPRLTAGACPPQARGEADACGG
jgi:hypothetical protein